MLSRHSNPSSSSEECFGILQNSPGDIIYLQPVVPSISETP